MYCFNDIAHSHPLGHVNEMTLREVLDLREKSDIDHNICDDCSLRGRYRPAELASACLGYLKMRLARKAA